jgi:NTE family protein
MSLGFHCSPPTKFSPTKTERVALLLRGGGTLDACQAGLYEAPAENGIHPNWLAGIVYGCGRC